MPTYELRCEHGHTCEIVQGICDPLPRVCSTCGAPLKLVLHAPAIRFKGSGFYSTDYPKGGTT